MLTCWPSYSSNVIFFLPKHYIAPPFAASAGIASAIGSMATSGLKLFGQACVQLPLSSNRKTAPPHE
eukprot:1713481-Heterocapsa_arctica.AAC.2